MVADRILTLWRHHSASSLRRGARYVTFDSSRRYRGSNGAYSGFEARILKVIFYLFYFSVYINFSSIPPIFMKLSENS